MEKDYKNFFSLITAFAFILLIISLYLILENPTRGYELSIYEKTPIIVWISLFFSLINGIIILNYYVIKKIRRLVIIGFLQIFLSLFVLISLYGLRGYEYLERADTLSYIGMAKDISFFGLIPNYNYYPWFSAFASQLNLLTNADVQEISKYVPAFFYLLDLLFILILAKAIFDDKQYIILVFLSTIPINFAWFSLTITHMYIATLFIPLIFYFIFKNTKKNFPLILMIFIMIFPFSHPIIVFLLILFLVIVILLKYYKKESQINNVYNILILFLAISIIWYSYQFLIIQSFSKIITQIFNEYHVTTASQGLYFIQKLGLFNSIKSFILMSLDEIVYTILIGIVIITALLKKKSERFNIKILILIVCFIFGNLLIVIVFFMSNVHTPYRFINLNPNFILVSPIVGFLIFSHLKNIRAYKFLIFILIVLVFSTTISLYQSPITTLPTDQVTKGEIFGVKWLIANKDISIRTIDEKTPIFRYADLIYGYDFKFHRNDLGRDADLDYHFSNSQKPIFIIDTMRYLIISNYFITSYETVWNRLDAFNTNDFARLDHFYKNVYKIYDNSDTKFYLLN